MFGQTKTWEKTGTGEFHSFKNNINHNDEILPNNTTYFFEKRKIIIMRKINDV